MPPSHKIFEWTPDLALPVNALNEDHRRIFALAEQLHEAMLASQGRQHLGRLLDGLVEHTRGHLAREEELMQHHRYPDLEAHRAQHQILVSKVAEFSQRVSEGETTMTIELMHFLSDWMEKHIRGSDLRLAEWLAGHGIKA